MAIRYRLQPALFRKIFRGSEYLAVIRKWQTSRYTLGDPKKCENTHIYKNVIAPDENQNDGLNLSHIYL